MKLVSKLLSFLKGSPKPQKKSSKRYNAKLSVSDPKDANYRQDFSINKPLPNLVDLRPKMPPVYNQGDVGSCTGNASAAAFEYLQLQELAVKGLSPEEFDPAHYTPVSRLFIYYNERKLNNDTGEDAGATIRDSVLSLLYWGVCKESSWQYNDPNALICPTHEAYQEAIPHKISKYYRFDDLAHIKHSLAAGYPVIIGITVYESFESDQVAATGIVPIPSYREQCLGGHAVCVVGYDDSKACFIVRNSWGAEWGDKGYFYLPYAYMENPNLSDDWWTIRK